MYKILSNGEIDEVEKPYLIFTSRIDKYTCIAIIPERINLRLQVSPSNMSIKQTIMKRREKAMVEYFFFRYLFENIDDSLKREIH